MRTALALVLLTSLAAGCAHQPASDKAWTMKNLWEAVDSERQAQEIYR